MHMRIVIEEKGIASAVVLAFLAALLPAGCAGTDRGSFGAGGLMQPSIAIELPEEYNTPDGMALDGFGNIILSFPNFNDDRHPAKILKIDQEDRITEVITLPVHPVTKKVGPLGVAVGKDGHLYVADNQSDFIDTPSSRLLRVRMEEGRAAGCEVLVTGFVQSNAVSCQGDFVYNTHNHRPDRPVWLPVYHLPCRVTFVQH